jgi:lipid-A-disaccharide synthase-like uncharacterized protein
MPVEPRRAGVAAALAGLALLLACTSAPAPASRVHVQLAGVRDRVEVHRLADGSFRFELRATDGGTLLLTPDALAARVYEEGRHRPWWEHLLNITSPAGIAWVALGLLGQLLFTGRMVVQWLVSERHRRSVVPAVFWWLSLAGASMLLVYFVWRRDAVGALGQLFGWVVYLRNLWLIHRSAPGSPSGASRPSAPPEGVAGT